MRLLYFVSGLEKVTLWLLLLQCVPFCEVISEECYVACGMPHGPLLGPLLFVVYINDFSKSIIHAKGELYADDTILLFGGKKSYIIKHWVWSEFSLDVIC